jgi:1-deoxy-D-xylulose-5-phosphate reductoisomerase
MKSIAIFGSTGTIGQNALEVVAQHVDRYCVEALVAQNNVDLIIRQALQFEPKYVALENEKHYNKLKSALSHLKNTEILVGKQAINDLAGIKFDFFLSAIVGLAGLEPTFKAIEAGSDIGMANKESLVAAGTLMLDAARKSGAQILPIDSEHNAIFQIFERENLAAINKVTLTASGGPFLHFSAEQMRGINKEQALKHPNWHMGPKISVDSATMMNKALEVIEAFHLFPISKEQIDIVIHPESIIHGLVEYADGSSLAMLSQPDMQTPIAAALAYPERIKIKYQPLNLAEIGRFNFMAPDEQKFPALQILREVLRSEEVQPCSAACIFNAANEVAVEQFLQGKIAFNQIINMVKKALDEVETTPIGSIEDVMLVSERVKLIL